MSATTFPPIFRQALRHPHDTPSHFGVVLNGLDDLTMADFCYNRGMKITPSFKITSLKQYIQVAEAVNVYRKKIGARLCVSEKEIQRLKMKLARQNKKTKKV